MRVVPFDRFYLAEQDISVTHWQLSQYYGDRPTDPLKFPIESVEELIDSRGIQYREGIDFKVLEGRIQWGPNNPGTDPNTGNGRVYSVRYLYKPYFIVDTNSHEVRVATQPDPITGGIISVLMPQMLAVRRENVFRDRDNDPQSINPDPAREKLGPVKPTFGPR